MSAHKTEYWACDSTTLARLITRDWDQKAYEEWLERYGHEFPVMAIINGQEVRHES